MAENNEKSLFQEQKKTKPKIEDIAGNFLDNEKTSNLLALVEFIRANKIGIQWASGNSWTLNFKSKRFGYIKINNGVWRFSHNRVFLENYYNMEENDLKKFIFDNIYIKESCGDCMWDQKASKAGYMKPTDCHCWPLRIYNPNKSKLEKTKQLITFRINCFLDA